MGKRSGVSTKIAIALVLALVVFCLFDTILDRFYIFNPTELQKIATEAIAKHKNDTKGIITDIVKKLEASHPGHINTEQQWIFNNAGGAMGALYIIHASISEYVIIFGTPIGTEGHTGRYLADDFFIIIDGEQWAFSEGSLDKEVWIPGEMHHLPRGQAQAYRMPGRCWALEYARGWIPAMLPFGIADTLTSTLDWHTLLRTFHYYGRLVIGELLQGKI